MKIDGRLVKSLGSWESALSGAAGMPFAPHSGGGALRRYSARQRLACQVSSLPERRRYGTSEVSERMEMRPGFSADAKGRALRFDVELEQARAFGGEPSMLRLERDGGSRSHRTHLAVSEFVRPAMKTMCGFLDGD